MYRRKSARFFPTRRPFVEKSERSSALPAGDGRRRQCFAAGYSSMTIVSPICAASISASQYGKRTHSLRLYSAVWSA